MATDPKPPVLSDDEVQRELVNDSLGTVDLAGTTYTDPQNDTTGDKGIRTRENA
jgi:hypothetical protein